MLRDAKLILILAIGTLTVMAGAVVVPNLPDLVADFQLDPEIAGILVGTHFITVALSVPGFGVLSDRVGSLPVLVPSLLGYALFGSLGAVVPGFQSLMVVRALLGVSTGGLTASSMGLLGKFYHGEERQQVLAYASGALAIGNILYPLIAGLLGQIGWRWAFCMYWLAIPFALGCLTLLRREAAKLNASGDRAASAGEANASGHIPLHVLVTDPKVLPMLLSMLLTSGTIYIAFVYLPIYMREELQAATASIGMVLATTAIGSGCIAAFGVRRLAQTFGNLTTSTVAYGLLAAMLLAFPNVTSLPLMFAVALCFGLALGTIMPSLYGYLSSRTPTRFQATILATGTGLGFLGQFLAPIALAPIVARYDIISAFWTAALFALGTGVLMAWQLSQRITLPNVDRSSG
ncbi:MAG: MFS transporter [Geitlerinemataceae cyanobacterium]